MTELELRMPARPVRIGIAAAEFNRFITDQLLEGATDAFTRNGLSEDQRVLAWVPGAFELPLAARGLLESGCDAALALGAVIRGGTPHFDYVAGECARGLSRLALDYGRPVLFGVLTTDDVEQAMRVLKKKLQNDGLFRRLKAKRSYEKPSECRRRKRRESERRRRINSLKASRYSKE